MVHQPDGRWSAPGFYSIGGGTVGLQVGFETAKIVFFVMSEDALQRWLRGDFKFGAQDGVAVFLKGSELSAKTSQGADVLAWVRASGAYAGITLEGTDVSYNVANNRAYYGRIVSTEEIFGLGTAANPGAEPLRDALATR